MGNPYAPPGDRPSGPPPQPRQPPQRLPQRRRAEEARRAPRPPPDPARARVASRLVARFALLVLASLVCNGLKLPWQAAALVFSLAALVVGTMALRAARRAGLRQLPVVMLVLGLVMTALLSLGQIGIVALWPLQSDLQQCQRRALTLQATEACQDEFDRRIMDLTRRRPSPS